MKKIISLILIFTLALSFAACRKNDPTKDIIPNGMKLASNPELCEYSLFVPEGWIVDIQTSLTSARVGETDSSSLSVSAFTNASIPESDDMLTKYWESYTEDLKSVFDKKDDGSSTFTPSEPETITLKKGEKNVAAIKVTYTASLSGTELKYIQVISYDNAYFYIMTFTTTPDGFAKNIDDFNSVIANFTFDN